jgi:hypothetical protein
VRKSEHAIEQARRRLYRKASKKQMSTRPATLDFVQYVHVFTTRSSGCDGDLRAVPEALANWRVQARAH